MKKVIWNELAEAQLDYMYICHSALMEDIVPYAVLA